jgi:hypothetical protein
VLVLVEDKNPFLSFSFVVFIISKNLFHFPTNTADIIMEASRVCPVCNADISTNTYYSWCGLQK